MSNFIDKVLYVLVILFCLYLVWIFILKPLINYLGRKNRALIMKARDIQIKQIRYNIKSMNISKEELFDEE